MAYTQKAGASATCGNRARQVCGGDEPGQFPVVIVRPATVTLPTYLRRHRRRVRGANRMAALLTEHSRAAGRPWPALDWGFDINLDEARDYLIYLTAGRDGLREVMRQARALAEAPPLGAVRIGRKRRGRAVVVVLHAPEWSLVLRRAQPYPAVWVFLGAAGGYSFRFYGTGELSTQWYDMARDVYTTLTGDTG